MGHDWGSDGHSDDAVVAVEGVNDVFADDNLADEVGVAQVVNGKIVLGDLEGSVEIGNVPNEETIRAVSGVGKIKDASSDISGEINGDFADLAMEVGSGG